MENDRLQTDRLGSSRTEDCLVINVYTPVVSKINTTFLIQITNKA